MTNTVIKVENLSKLYRLGEVGTGTISHDLNRWWARVRKKEDPFAKVGATNDRTQAAAKGEHVWALKDINFEVKQGEVLGIIGKNGAGKSTLLKILSRITSPTTGHIKAKGRIASLLEVGTGFHQEMTGRENVYLNGTILGMTKKEIDKKYEEIMDFAGCLKYADTPVKRYSSGMMVRLGFAVAAFLEPEILIVDEVLAVGDAEFQKKAIGKMQDISSGEGRTVLFVSHNMASVNDLCSNVLLIKNGSVELIAEPEEVIKQYLSIGKQAGNRISDYSGNGIFIHSIILEGTKENNYIYMDDPLKLVVSFDNRLDKNLIQFNFRILNEYGNIVLTDFPKTYLSADPNQIQYYTCKIPGNLFNEGQYFIEVNFVKERSVILSLKNIISFEVVPKVELRGGWHHKIKGIIRPNFFEWEQKLMGIV